MSLQSDQLSKDMITAFKGAFLKKWPLIQLYAEAEAKKLAQTMVMIEQLKLSGNINQEQAVLHMEIQKNATRMVLLAIKGLSILAVEAAIKAALDTVKGSVNTALGFTLL